MTKQQKTSKTPEEEIDGFTIYETERFRLKDVFKKLCDLRTSTLQRRLHEIQAEQQRSGNGFGEQNKVEAGQEAQKGMAAKGGHGKRGKKSLSDEARRIVNQIKKIKLDPSGPYFTAREVAEQLKFLRSKWKDNKKQKPRFTKSEIDLMIWEVDEDLDQKIRWKEYEMMFKKCMKDERDQKGLEPRALFNLVRFMMFDETNKGLISAEDTYNLLFVRWDANNNYFKEKRARNDFSGGDGHGGSLPRLKQFDTQIQELFGFRPTENRNILISPDAEKKLTFFEYLDKINELAIEFRKKKKIEQKKLIKSQ